MSKENKIPEVKENVLYFTDPQEIVDFMTPLIPTLDHTRIQKEIQSVKEFIKNYKGDTSMFIPLLKRMDRRLKDTEKFNGSTPTPNTLIRNAIMTKESIKLLGEIIDQKGKVFSNVEISKTFNNALYKNQYLMDAIGWYVRQYSMGPTPLMTWDQNPEWECYVIRDTFDNFCKNCGAEKEDRKQLKEVLFGDKRPLERLPLFVPYEKGKKLKVEIRFISARITTGLETSSQIGFTNTETFTEIGDMILEVNAKIYRFLDKEQNSNDDKNLFYSYQNRPLAMMNRIQGMIAEAVILATSKDTKDTIGLNIDGINQDMIGRAINHLMDKWNTSYEDRKTDMEITTQELATLGYIPKYRNSHIAEKRERQKRDTDIIARILRAFLETNDKEYPYLKKCENITLSYIDAKKGYKITFIKK